MVKAVTSGEKYLLEALDRIAKNPDGNSVLYVNISKLKPKNRHPEFVKIFARLFDTIVGVVRGQLFILSNGDFAILGKNIADEMVEEAVKKIRLGLSSDPTVHGKDTTEFAGLYHFPEDFFRFYSRIELMLSDESQSLVIEKPKRAIKAEEVDDIGEQLELIEISEIVKRQSILKFLPERKHQIMYQEFFVAVKDLNAQIGQNIDVMGNRWLFLYLSQILDKKTLNAFFASDIQVWPKYIGINLNLSSVYSKEFVNLAKNFLKKDQKLIVEVQLMDVFNDIPLYFKVKELLHSGGHKLLIDSLNVSSLNMLDIKNLEPDLIKIFWEPLLEDDLNNSRLKQVIQFMGVDNVILAKCDSNKALEWGLKYKLNSFQGPFIDMLEISLLQKKCPDTARCTPQECLKRRRLLWGGFRDKCTQKGFLEDLL